MKNNLFKINKITFLAFFVSCIMSLPAIAMKETDAHQAFAKYAENTNKPLCNKKTLLSWLRPNLLKFSFNLFKDPHFPGFFKLLGNDHIKDNGSYSKPYRSGMYWGEGVLENIATEIIYEKQKKNGYKKCTFHQAVPWKTRYPLFDCPQLTDDEKTNALDSHFALAFHDMKECNEISFPEQFEEQMNAYNPKRSQQTLFNIFASLATCVKKDGKEICTVILE